MKRTVPLVDDVILSIASLLGNPRDVLAMASVCCEWQDVLERQRTHVLAMTWGVPFARCEGSTSLANALDLWDNYLYAWQRPERTVELGTTTPLQLQLLFLPSQRVVTSPNELITRDVQFGLPDPSCWKHQTFYTNLHYNAFPIERPLVFADGLAHHAALFHDLLKQGLILMWKNAATFVTSAIGSVLYYFFASQSPSVPLPLLSETFKTVHHKMYNNLIITHSLDATFYPVLATWALPESDTRMRLFLTRYLEFWATDATTRLKFGGALEEIILGWSVRTANQGLRILSSLLLE